MRAANIVAIVSAFAWLAYALIGMDLVTGVAERVGGADIEQVKFYVLRPMLVALAIAATAWLCNGFQREVWAKWVLGIVSASGLVVLLPYCAISSGGV